MRIFGRHVDFENLRCQERLVALGTLDGVSRPADLIVAARTRVTG